MDALIDQLPLDGPGNTAENRFRVGIQTFNQTQQILKQLNDFTTDLGNLTGLDSGSGTDIQAALTWVQLFHLFFFLTLPVITWWWYYNSQETISITTLRFLTFDYSNIRQIDIWLLDIWQNYCPDIWQCYWIDIWHNYYFTLNHQISLPQQIFSIMLQHILTYLALTDSTRSCYICFNRSTAKEVASPMLLLCHPNQWKCELTPYSQRANMKYPTVGSFEDTQLPHSELTRWAHTVRLLWDIPEVIWWLTM